MKTLNINQRRAIDNDSTTGLAKKMGRSVSLRPDWEDIKDDIMLEGLYRKFADDELADWLVDTGDEELVEGNWWGDRYWGVCNGVGQNKLGKLLMKVRSEIKKERGLV